MTAKVAVSRQGSLRKSDCGLRSKTGGNRRAHSWRRAVGRLAPVTGGPMALSIAQGPTASGGRFILDGSRADIGDDQSGSRDACEIHSMDGLLSPSASQRNENRGAADRQ